MHWLKKVLEVILKSGLTNNREKSKFCANQVRYVGYLVDQQGCHVNPQETEPIISYPPLKTLNQLRRFLGIVSWYRCYVRIIKFNINKNIESKYTFA